MVGGIGAVTSLRARAPIRGRIQVGLGEARSRKKKPSMSVHMAGPRGPAGARQSPSRVLIVGFVSREL